MIPDLNRIHQGDCLAVMRTWPDAFVHCVVTSPPYWGLRDYGVAGQLGMENTPAEFVEKMVEVFREVGRVLRPDGTLWINIGDSYNSAGRKGHGNRSGYKQNSNRASRNLKDQNRPTALDLKRKDLVGIPWMAAFALRAEGWYLRQDIIWSKPNPMPESVTDRCTKSHEYLFMFSKSEKYFYDQEAIKEPTISFGLHGQDESGYKDAEAFNGKNRKSDKQRGHGRKHEGFNDRWDKMEREQQCTGMRNKRSVWEIAPANFAESHFATFPPDLIAPCILAGSPRGGVVLDPFMGAGTTALVAARYDRRFLGIELNPEYIHIAERRVAAELAQGKMF